MDTKIILLGLFCVIASSVFLLILSRHKLMASLPKDPVEKVYDAIDYAIKTYKPYLELDVTSMSSDVFVALYRGLRSQGVKVDYKQVDDEYDFMTVDLRQYKGPRNQTLERRMDFPPQRENQTQTDEGSFVTPIHSNKMVSGDYSPFQNPFNRVVKAVKPNKEPAAVIDLAAYRKRKQGK